MARNESLADPFHIRVDGTPRNTEHFRDVSVSPSLGKQEPNDFAFRACHTCFSKEARNVFSTGLRSLRFFLERAFHLDPKVGPFIAQALKSRRRHQRVSLGNIVLLHERGTSSAKAHGVVSGLVVALPAAS